MRGSIRRPGLVRGGRWPVLLALYLTALALLLCLQFVVHTSGATLFLFSTFSPLLVAVAVVLVGWVVVAEYRESHRLFATEHRAAADIIFRQGEPGECAYFVRSGTVEVIDEASGRVLARLGPGEHFGEMALLGNAPRNATVRAATDVELAALGKHNFLSMMRLLPATEETIMATVRDRAMRRDHEN